MVLYTASEEHFSSTLHFMNDLRKEGSFCDIVLKVGQDEMHAHRCVLAAGSPYFRSLFLGQFTEASMKEINLSAVSVDVAAMELILNFIYSGEVDINSENLGIIIKLSSFFLLETLREFCADFMTVSLCLNNCLTYYIAAADHGLMILENTAGFIITSRFHDCLIYEDNTLDLSTEQLMFLLDKGIFKHCSASSVLQFLMKWIIRGQSTQHVEVGSELLEALKKKECGSCQICSGLTELSLESLHDKVKTVIQEKQIEQAYVFLNKLSSTLCTLFQNKKTRCETVESIEQTAGPSTETPERSARHIFDCPRKEESELAIITLSPKMCVIEDYRKQREDSLFHHEAEPFHQPVFDLCAYVPRTKSWYYLREFKEHETPEYLVDGAGYESRFFLLGEHVVFVDNRGDNIDLYNLKTNQWHAPNVSYYDANFDIDFDNAFFQANDVCFVLGKNDEKYMVVRMRLFTDQSLDQATEMYFRGYILADDGESWDCIFMTSSRIRTNLSDNGGMPEMNARISKTSNEMIVTHSTLDGGWNIVFVADMNDPFPAPVILMSEFIEDKDVFRGVAILEEDDRFLIVSNGTKNCGSVVSVMYEYKFNSKLLREIHSKKTVISSILKPFEGDDEETEYPCLCEVSVTDGKSIWYLEGNMDTVSGFTEVSLGKNMKIVAKEHPPPPFSCITRMFAGQVYKRHLTDIKQITRFLMREKKTITNANNNHK